jgi:hypothetical protein
MKKFFIFKVFVLITLSVNSQEFKNSIATNGIGILGRIVAPTYRNNLFYERTINNTISIGFDVEYGRYEYSTTETSGSIQNEYQITGWGFSPELRIYPFGKINNAPKGFFLGSYFKYYLLKDKYSEYNSTSYDLEMIYSNNDLSAYGFGFDTGYKFGGSNFIFEPLLGYAFGKTSNFVMDSRNKLTDDPFPIWTLFLRIEARIGFCF